jgi:hypothetical protein
MLPYLGGVGGRHPRISHNTYLMFAAYRRDGGTAVRTVLESHLWQVGEATRS